MRILIADDDPVNRKLMQSLLERAGHQVTAFEDGSDLLAEFEKNPCQLVVTDWLMPKMTGTELCTGIRRVPGIPYTHVIIVTSQSPREHTMEAFHAGVDDFMSKPFDPSELVARVGVAERAMVRQEEVSLRKALELSQGVVGYDNAALAELVGTLAHLYRSQRANARARVFVRRQLAIAKRAGKIEEIERLERELVDLDTLDEAAPDVHATPVEENARCTGS